MGSPFLKRESRRVLFQAPGVPLWRTWLRTTTSAGPRTFANYFRSSALIQLPPRALWFFRRARAACTSSNVISYAPSIPSTKKVSLSYPAGSSESSVR